MGSGVKKIASFAAPIVGGLFGGPAGAALGGAIGGGIRGKGLKGIALGAGTGYAGNVLGSSIGNSIGSSLGSVGGSSLGTAAGNVVGPVSGASVFGTSNALTNALANTTVSKALGGVAGNYLASGFADSLDPQSQELESQSSGPAPFSPSRDAQMDMPSSLSSFGSLAPEQVSSNLATQGVYGGGNGPQETSYFENLINRKLVDDSGNPDSDLSEVSPIESSYLSQLGLGGYTDSKSLLEALSKRRTNGVPA